MSFSKDISGKSLGYRKTAAAGETIAFGIHPFSRKVQHRKLALSFTEATGITHYRRTFRGTTFEADLATSGREYAILPVPPMNLPDLVTDFLQIRFNEIQLEPESKSVIFVTAPLEIAIALKAENGAENQLDTFGFASPKFALYGSATRGIITRYIESKVTGEPVPSKNYREFQLRLEIENTANTWVSLSRVILYMNNLIFYYDETSVAACASVQIKNDKTALVSCTDYALHDGMTRSTPQIPKRRFDPFCNVKKIMEGEAVIMDMGLI